jgi:hypothetical protein
VLDCRIAANFIPYGLANTDKGRNKILRVNDLLARRARAMLPCASLQGRRELVDSHPGKAFHRASDTVRHRPSEGRASAQERLANLTEITILQPHPVCGLRSRPGK